MEEVRYDADGNPITSNLADYAMSSAPPSCRASSSCRWRRRRSINPLGAKGIGESGTIGSTPAIQSAVVDAVSHLGVRHIDMPTTAERVWQAIQAAQLTPTVRAIRPDRAGRTDRWRTGRYGAAVIRRTHVLVDLDGTITDSFPAITGSLQAGPRRARGPADPRRRRRCARSSGRRSSSACR